MSVFAPCPKCSSTKSRKVWFTWWGGIIGPLLFTHVKCPDCGTAYNGKTGKSNDVVIWIWNGVGIVVGLGLVALFWVLVVYWWLPFGGFRV